MLHLAGQQTVGRFEIRDFLGRGAIGDVLLAWDPRQESCVALKVVRVSKTDPEMLQAEKNGLSLQAQLAAVAPQVAAVYDDGQDGDFFWVAMEYVDGTDLSEVLARGPLPEARAVTIALELVTMLEICHEFSAEVGGRRIFGIVHGDIKPENIRLQAEDRVRVLDFGIAKHLSQTRRFTVNLFGSLPYTPPERLERGVVDRHSDLWAVGVVLAAMVSGRRPFPGNTPEELEQAIRHGVPPLPLPAGSSPGLVQVVDKSLAFEVGRRYQSAGELKSDLEALRDGRPLAAAAGGGAAADLHATRRTVRPLSPDELHATEATRRTDRPPGARATQGGTGASGEMGQASEPAESSRWAGESGAAASSAAILPEPIGAGAGVPSPGSATAAGPGQATAAFVSPAVPSAQAASAGGTAAAPSPAAAVATMSGTAPPPPRRRHRVRRAVALLAALFLLAFAASQLWAWNQAKQLRRELAEVHPDLEAIAQRYSDASSWSLLSPDLFGVGDEILKSLTASGARILDAYHGDDPTASQRGWETAYGAYHTAAQIAPHDRAVRARMLYARAHLDRIASIAQRNQGDRKQALAMSRQAIEEFQEAARIDPGWPDPYLGLARIYAYDMFDLDALQKTLGELGRRGYRIGKRETAMLADAFRMQGLALEARAAQRPHGSDAEIALLRQAREDLEQAIRFYGDISDFAYASGNRQEAEAHLHAVEARLSTFHQLGFWERLGRTLSREFRGRRRLGGGG
jgi:tetratricopeptide (TPR) repeat protein